MIDQILKTIQEYDPAVGEAMQAELARERDGLELIASENVVSVPVMLAMGSPLTNKYAEGYPAKRYYGGCECVDVVEEIARQRAMVALALESLSYTEQDAVQHIFDELGKDGGFILCQDKMVSFRNDAKAENVKAVCDFVREYRV